MKTLSLAVEPSGQRRGGGPSWVSGRVLETEQLGSTDTTAQAGYYSIMSRLKKEDADVLIIHSLLILLSETLNDS